MWDMTNVPAYSFTDADLQRISYSQYYVVSREAFSHNFVGGKEWQISGQEQSVIQIITGEKDIWKGRKSFNK